MFPLPSLLPSLLFAILVLAAPSLAECAPERGVDEGWLALASWSVAALLALALGWIALRRQSVIKAANEAAQAS